MLVGGPGVPGGGLGFRVPRKLHDVAQVPRGVEGGCQARVAQLVGGDVTKPGRLGNPFSPLPNGRRGDVTPESAGEDVALTTPPYRLPRMAEDPYEALTRMSEKELVDRYDREAGSSRGSLSFWRDEIHRRQVLRSYQTMERLTKTIVWLPVVIGILTAVNAFLVFASST